MDNSSKLFEILNDLRNEVELAERKKRDNCEDRLHFNWRTAARKRR